MTSNRVWYEIGKDSALKLIPCQDVNVFIRHVVACQCMNILRISPGDFFSVVMFMEPVWRCAVKPGGQFVTVGRSRTRTRQNRIYSIDSDVLPERTVIDQLNEMQFSAQCEYNTRKILGLFTKGITLLFENYLKNYRFFIFKNAWIQNV